MRLLVRVLIQDRGCNVGLEESGTHSEHIEGESEWTDSVAALDNTGNGGNNHDYVGYTADGDTDADYLEATPFGICEPSTEDGAY